MKKYRVYYWKYRNDEYQDFEVEIYASNFDEAYKAFREAFRLVKIRDIREIV
jgi:hypothetical protein